MFFHGDVFMVSKESLQKFKIDSQKQNLTLKEVLRLPINALELDICLATLPSVVPMPKTIVDKIKIKHRIFRKSL